MVFDAVRGMAALAVCAGHLRAFFFVDFSAVPAPSLFDRLFYLATGLGHQAVVVFFVLSGWLVGGSVWQQFRHARFSGRDYSIARLCRLWVVLLPALAWTLALGSLGVWLSGGAGYDGSAISQIHSGPGPQNPLDLSFTTFLGNLFFLQTLVVPVLGSNGPLWSLANEFWYYAIFPCMAYAWFRRGSAVACLAGAAGLGIFALLPAPMQVGYALWLLGWLGFLLLPRLQHATAIALSLLSGALLAAALATAKLGGGWLGSDAVVGLALMGLISGLVALPPLRVRWWRTLSAALARISFSLYLFHFPLLAFVFFTFPITRQAPTLMTLAAFAGMLAGTLLAASGFWYLFERNTDRVRHAVRSAIARSTIA